MPHDKDGKEVKVGDVVNVPCVVKSVYPGAELCDVDLETVHGRKTDGLKERMTLNSATVELKPVSQETFGAQV